MAVASRGQTPSRIAPVASRWRLIAARVLTVLAIVLVVVSALADFVKRQALDESQFRDTSRALVADPIVRDQVAAILVAELYANADVSGALRERLPPDLQDLSGPIAGVVRDVADRSARRLLAQPGVQEAFVSASSAAQRQFVAVLDGDKTIVETSGGKVVLDVRPLVLDLGDRFALTGLESKIPEGAARITILESDQLRTAQDVTRLLRFVADWIWVLALVAAATAVWLARGRRRREIRANAIGLLIAGVLILVAQTMIGRYLVDELVTTESVRPAVASAYSILTDLLRGEGWTAIIVSVVALLGIWLSGPSPRAVAARRALSPYLRRPEVAYGALAVGYLLLLWWRPTPQFGFPLTVVVLFALALLGLEVLRRQTAREFPDTESSNVLEAARGMVGRPLRKSRSEGSVAELERLARLHTDGALDDAEFAAAKAQLLGPALETSAA